jgi:amino acid adenylation domain-containing protein
MSFVTSFSSTGDANAGRGSTPGACAHELFAQQAAESPNAIAISGRQEELSYGELDLRANRLAHYLRSLGVGRNIVVALYLGRSPAMAVAALAVLKAGGAYLPLDPIHPAERLAFMMRDSQAAHLISLKRSMQDFPGGNFQTVTLDGDAQAIAAQPETPLANTAGPDDLAYVIYTSGSTGQAKGVELIHAGLSNLVLWHHRAFQVTSADRASAQATVGFDAAVWELWAYLTAGASLHLPEDSVRNDANALRDWMVARRITISFASTAIAEKLLQLEWPPDTALRLLLTGADTLKIYPQAHVPFKLVNNYGPTECTVVSTSGIVPAGVEGNEAPSIGRAIDAVEIHILDENGQPVRGDAAGEIYIGGAGLGRGYRNRPDLTAQRFVANPSAPNSRLYRTGDLGRWTPNGEIAFLGRLDEQVKLRGYRVEPIEVSTVLAQHPAIQNCVVIATEDSPSEKQLIAFLVLAPNATVSAKALREHLRRRVPDYMVPSSFIAIDSLPITEQGKINRPALIGLGGTRLQDEVYVAPRTVVEEELVKILARLLKLERVGVNDNFFLLGGHSLLGTQVITRVSETFGVDLTLLKLFDHPTVAEMAEEIETLILTKLAEASRTSSVGDPKTRV